tara:strand:- start:1702 stop:2325 length:624 start_codon:yes stop_codon:yes gene_type:complete
VNKEAIEMALELDALALRAHAFGFGYEDEIFHPNWRNLVEEWVEVRGEIGTVTIVAYGLVYVVRQEINKIAEKLAHESSTIHKDIREHVHHEFPFRFEAENELRDSFQELLTNHFEKYPLAKDCFVIDTVTIGEDMVQEFIKESEKRYRVRDDVRANYAHGKHELVRVSSRRDFKEVRYQYAPIETDGTINTNSAWWDFWGEVVESK